MENEALVNAAGTSDSKRYGKLTLEQKFEILGLVDSGNSKREIALNYGVGVSTVYEIIRQRNGLV